MEYRTALSIDEIGVSPEAGEQFRALLTQVDDGDIEAIRIYVAGGGCSGMTYGMTFTDRRGEYDRVFDGDGYRIYIDAVAIGYLKGVEIDFTAGETGSRFVFSNVFQTTGGSGACGGCGMAGGG